MGIEVKTQSEASKAYDLLRGDWRVEFCLEPDRDEIESQLRALTAADQSAPQLWSDAYPAAFALA